MADSHHRDVINRQFMGVEIDFVADNERVRNEVQSLSNERHLLEEITNVINMDDVYWDVGSCLGIHAFFISQYVTDGEVVCFEPMPANRAVCMDNKSINDISNMWISQKALANETGEKEFEIRESIEAGFGRHSIKPPDKDYDSIKTIDVPVVNGDSVTELPSPNIVKIDVEGASPLVLQGMSYILNKPSCRHVFLETHEPNEENPSHEDFGWTREEIIEYLESFGFTVDTLQKDYHLHATKNDTSKIDISTSKIDISIIQGDIANQSSDVIVNSAGTSLRMGSGVAGSLRNEGGDGLYYEALEQGPVELGSAIRTNPHGLDCNHVIHAVSMPHYGEGKSTPMSIRMAIQNTLEKTDSLNSKTITIPAIGCGLGGVPLATGVEEILEELISYNPDSIEEVDIIAYTEEEYKTILNLISNP